MNTSVYSSVSEPSWSRRCSIESTLSIQGKETDFVRDSSDTEPCTDDGQDVEFEPCTDPEDDPVFPVSSSESDNEIIATKVMKVSLPDEGDLEFADSELTDGRTDASDSEVEPSDYWRCAQCGANNNNPLYRYCERCFQVRKNLFPPRPKRKHKRRSKEREISRLLSQNSVTHNKDGPLSPGNVVSQVDDQQNVSDQPQTTNAHSLCVLKQVSQELERLPLVRDVLSSERTCSQDSGFDSQGLTEPTQSTSSLSTDRLNVSVLKRRAGSVDRKSKRVKVDFSSDSLSDEDVDVTPLLKTISDPALTIENVKVTKKVLAETAKEVDKDNNMCIVCLTEPKSGAFVHGRIAHICCCYKCAVKVWAKAKRCPVCNCKVSNVLRAVVM